VRGKRLFVSLDFPESITAALVRLDPRLKGVHWCKAEQIHLTLAFLGQVESRAEEVLLAHLSSIRFHSFFLPFQGLGTFPGKGSPRILWLGVGHGHPHLFELHKKVADAALRAGLQPELRPWHPHVTLARCEHVSAERLRPLLRQHEDFDLGLVPINFFTLKSSLLTPAGSIYTTEVSIAAS
jgi:2'-5' RNA ligase